MKAVGVRKLDNIGRIALPIKTRREFSIHKGDSMAVYIDDNRIILKKYEPGCVFCGEVKDTTEIEGKKICKNCATELVLVR